MSTKEKLRPGLLVRFEMARNTWDWRPWLALGLVMVLGTLFLARWEFDANGVRRVTLSRLNRIIAIGVICFPRENDTRK